MRSQKTCRDRYRALQLPTGLQYLLLVWAIVVIIFRLSRPSWMGEKRIDSLNPAQLVR